MANLTKVYFQTGSELEPVLRLENTGLLGFNGMRHRLFLSKDQAVLFEFSQAGDHAFWMDEVCIPLDIIFLDQDDTVVHIHEDAKPLTRTPIRSGYNVVTVIETNAGWCKENYVVPGVRVRFQLG